jgi:hypothetical protein
VGFELGEDAGVFHDTVATMPVIFAVTAVGAPGGTATAAANDGTLEVPTKSTVLTATIQRRQLITAGPPNNQHQPE